GRRVLRPRPPRRLPHVRVQAHLPHVATGRGVPGPGPSPGRPGPQRHAGGHQRRRRAVSATLTGVVTPGVRAALRGQHPTPEQLAAITAPLGPVHVIAGAGSGKTAAMAARIVYLVERLGGTPAAVLGLTFTNKAASEPGARGPEALADLPPEVGDEVTVDTYHAWAADLVKAYGIRVGIEVDADLLTEAQQYQILLGILDGERFEHLSVRTAGATIRKTLELASACADHVVPAERVVEASRRLLQRAEEGERLPDWMLQAARERIELARPGERYGAPERAGGALARLDAPGGKGTDRAGPPGRALRGPEAAAGPARLRRPGGQGGRAGRGPSGAAPGAPDPVPARPAGRVPGHQRRPAPADAADLPTRRLHHGRRGRPPGDLRL